jgi:hypothetical protein
MLSLLVSPVFTTFAPLADVEIVFAQVIAHMSDEA